MNTLQKALKTQLDHYRNIIQDATDRETAEDLLDGVDLILADHVISERFGEVKR